MASDRRFENPPAREHRAASAVLEAVLCDEGSEDEATAALVGLALHDDDRAFVESWCVELGRRLPSGSPLLGLAALCIGHLARRFRHVSDEAANLVVELADRAVADPADVDYRAQDGLDDVAFFTGRTVRQS